MRVRVTQESAALILDRWEALSGRLRKPSAWITLLRLAATHDWTTPMALAGSGRASAVCRLLANWHKDSLVDRRYVPAKTTPRIEYRITAEGMKLLNRKKP